MSEVPLRRFAVLIVCVLAVAGCKSADHPVTPIAGACSSGMGSPDHDTPVVCVDGSASALTVNPESIRVWDVGSADHKTPPTIQWITRGGGGNLQITMKDAGCVETPSCNGHGHCGAQVINGIGAGKNEGDVIKQCRYTVTLDGRVLDPDAVIVRCCSGG
jgi:hypothetical protein